MKRHTILIVEDELLIRMDIADCLQQAGFEVVEVGNADEAILVLEKRLDITLVFTDVQMPGTIDGLKLAAAIRGRWPPIKIVVTSAHVGVRDGDLPNGSRFIPKPYESDRIIDTLRELLKAA